MSLGTGALKVCKGPEHFRPRQGGIHGNHVSGNRHAGRCQLTPSHWNQISGKMLTWPLYLPKKFKTSEGKADLAAWIHTSKFPASNHVCFRGNPVTPLRHKPATSIALILTLPKLHLATYKKAVFHIKVWYSFSGNMEYNHFNISCNLISPPCFLIFFSLFLFVKCIYWP